MRMKRSRGGVAQPSWLWGQRASRLLFFLLLSLGGCLTTSAITLDAVLQQTLQKNPRILQAKSELQAAGGQRLVLRASALPKALIGAVAGDQGGQRSQDASNTPFIFAYGAFSQPLLHAEISATYRRAEVGLLVAQQQLNVAVTQELHQARLAFYAALYNRALESLGQSQREQLEKNIAGEKARYEAGNTDRGAFTSATLLARELDPKIESAHRAYAGAVLQLAQSMGRSLGQNAILPATGGDINFSSHQTCLTTGRSMPLCNGAPISNSRGSWSSAAREDQRIVAAGYYPAVDAVASGEAIPVSGIHRDNHGSPEATDDTVASEVRGGVSYTWRVVDNGRVGGAALNARSIREANELELRKLEASVPRAFAQVQNDLRAIAGRYQSLSRAADVAERDVVAIQQNREQGLASILDFRTAETNLLATHSGIFKAVFDEQVALAQWDLVSGRYFQFSDDTAAKVH